MLLHEFGDLLVIIVLELYFSDISLLRVLLQQEVIDCRRMVVFIGVNALYHIIFFEIHCCELVHYHVVDRDL